jgi:hypothetical protein
MHLGVHASLDEIHHAALAGLVLALAQPAAKQLVP